MKRATSLTLGVLMTLTLEGQAAPLLPVPGMSGVTLSPVTATLAASASPGRAAALASPAVVRESRPTTTTVRVPLPASFYFFLSGLVSFAIVLRQQRRQCYAGAPPA